MSMLVNLQYESANSPFEFERLEKVESCKFCLKIAFHPSFDRGLYVGPVAALELLRLKIEEASIEVRTTYDPKVASD